MIFVAVFLVLLSSIQALLTVGAAAWLLMSAMKSSEPDAEEQERAMFRELAEAPGSRVPGPEPVDAPPALVCPEMPDLARLGAALSEAQAKAQTELQPDAEALRVSAELPR